MTHNVTNSLRPRLALPQGLYLRRFELGDASQLRRIMRESEDIRRFLGYVLLASVKEATRFIRSIHAEERANTARWWAVVDDDRLAGAVFFLRLELKPSRWGQKTGTLGYWLDGAYRNRGIATAAVRLVLAFGFKEWRLHKVKIGHVRPNLASEAVIKKTGFRLVGIERDEFYWHGQWMDHVVYELLSSDWRNREPLGASGFQGRSGAPVLCRAKAGLCSPASPAS
jgi:RimJ/RimL family protein N-acetyltransferase